MEHRCNYIHFVCVLIFFCFFLFLFIHWLDRLCGFPPFFDDGSNMGKLFDQIMSGEFDYPDEYWEDISDEGKNSFPFY